ncbi:MAG: methyl-accepting chemotaxis protein [Thermodesulfobacteriota bacterium]|nr:methyl-accepting chemotaxis protein [Thermodesulfobacteriota bacterium]
MFNTLFQRLQVKVVLTLGALFLIVLGSMTFLNVWEHGRSVKQATKEAGLGLANSIYTSILFPMSRGDGDTVKRQLSDLKNNMEDVEVMVFGADKTIVYGSNETKEGTSLSDELHDPSLASAVDTMLTDGKAPEQGYEETIGGKRYLSVVRPMVNEPLCHHCHGATREVLGGLVARQFNEEMYAGIAAVRNRNLLMALGGSALTVLLVYFLIARMVIRPVRIMKENAESMAKGDLTRQVTIASQDELGDLAGSFNKMTEYLNTTIGIVEASASQLAEGASAQAAAVEETSSSIEEISSTMTHNTQHSKEVQNVMGDTKDVLSDANSSMKDLMRSLEETSAASDNIGKIIKTIQEIAFQTNLLALNAAVEAARAGEAGSGFAVVAEEVRNLAMRSAEAAQDTENLIEDIVGRIKKGTDLVEKTDDQYRQVAVSANKVNELIAEITAAIEEQTTGIQQVNNAISEVDRVAQNSAASAEELSSSVAIFKTNGANTVI